MRLRSVLLRLAAAAAILHASTCPADAVLDWNEVALAASVAAKQLPPDGARALAMMHVAMFDAANAIERRYRPYAFKGRAHPGTSTDAAVSAAARDVLLNLFPDQAQSIEAAYTKAMTRVPQGDSRDSGVALGSQVAAECIAMRVNDGTGAVGSFVLKGSPGVYMPTVFPVSAEWAHVKPWFMKSPAQFRPGPPPLLTSAEWSRDLEEIRAVGGARSTKRTPEQTEVGRFWAITGVPSWNPIVRSLAQSGGLDLVDMARLFALVNMAATDAFIAVFDAKYAYEFWRPVSAIRNGGGDRTWADVSHEPVVDQLGHEGGGVVLR